MRATSPTDPSIRTRYWSISAESLIELLHSNLNGLTDDQASQRLAEFGANRLQTKRRAGPWRLLFSQFKSPIILILIGAAILSLFLQDTTDALIILAIVIASGLLGFWQEHSAANAVSKLRSIVEVNARVLRDGVEKVVPVENVVSGDVILLSAGNIVPADCRLLETRDLFLSEATLTGETYPVEKTPGTHPAKTALAQRTNATYMGTHAISGSGKAIAVHTGRATEFGKVFDSLRLRPPQTEFERGIRHFGYLLAEVTLLLVISIFAFNVYFHKPVLESFLFALALAVGLTPQLLPAIISINLSHGARRMAERKVIVKRLTAIENFGSMNVLCSDKTGTITEGVVHLHAALDPQGRESSKVMLYAYLNAANETGLLNPIDEAIRECKVPGAEGWRKLDELPYDFLRKRLSILLEKDGHHVLVTKGALRQILTVCTRVEHSDGSLAEATSMLPEIERHWREFSDQGRRVLGIAYREFGSGQRIAREDESGMVFLGFVVLSDPPKAGVVETIRELAQLGVRLKIITGDNTLIAAHVAREVGLDNVRILSGSEIHKMSSQALMRRATEVDIFAEVEPTQKEEIIRALKKAGHVVGYIGDGINDAPALHAADVSLSVEGAADVAREAADFVLLEHDLEVLVDGVREGRRTFANTLKYVFIATSANFGNMFSMAGASLFLPFLPLLPKQILLINLLTDFPEMTIAGDNVDPELVEAPRRWDISFIRRFMIVFGLVSSTFDLLTFVVLLRLNATMEEFRTGWFIESIVSAALIVLVVRSRRSFYRSRPSRLLTCATLAIVIIALFVPHMPFSSVLGFQSMPAHFYPIIGLIVGLYVVTAEVAKHLFYRRARNSSA
jgi:P-type Mg2+ transporter